MTDALLETRTVLRIGRKHAAHLPRVLIEGSAVVVTTTPRGYLARQLGAGILAARERASRSQRAQARELGIAGNTLRELELGIANPTLARIEDLADGLDLTIELKVKPKRGRR